MNMKYAGMIFILSFAVLSCKKDNNSSDNCYSCKVQRFGGAQDFYYQDVCTNKIDTVQFKDQNGNNLQSVCTPK
jgi:hypothetical protein